MTQDCFEILLPLPFDTAFTYKNYELDLKIGDLVKVPFRKKELWGLVLSTSNKGNLVPEKIKSIIAKNDDIKFNTNLIKFIEQISNYNLAKKGLVLKAFIGIINSNKTKKLPQFLTQKVDLEKIKLKTLSSAQQEIVDKIENCTNPLIHLLDAVTGSGKTEIYFALIAKILATQNDAQILILLPEISLTSQLLTRFEEQFGFSPALWHSKISPKEKRDIFYGIVSGSTRVLIGARSALLLPFKNLQLIIIDEEHDSSFKQEDIFNFNARDMAILKANINNFKLILSSATPSLESYQNAKNNKYNYFSLREKFHNKSNNINIIDLRREKPEKGCHISQNLRDALAKNFANSHQSLLFLNRRGYSPVTLCKSCGQKINCLNCSSYLVHHKHSQSLICHYCGHHEHFNKNCKHCAAQDSIINIGVGVEKIAEEISSLMPQARIALITSDNVKNFAEVKKIVAQISANEIDIIIGTQIIAKGYDFANLTLVGVVDADSGFYGAELKSTEKSFQLLNQVIGRAGRRSKLGEIFIQTYNPQNFVFEKIIQNDQEGFYQFEIANRKSLNMPPFTKMAEFTISAFEQAKSLLAAKKLLAQFPFDKSIEVFGPAATAIARVKNRYYYRVLLKVEKKINLQKLITDVMSKLDFEASVEVKIDIDPI